MSQRSISRQKAILEAVERLNERYGRSATPLEVAEEIGIPPSSTRYHVRKLVTTGQLISLFGGRGLRLPESQP
jgi:DNA-directed RNA polymerase specialized sigma subunit